MHGVRGENLSKRGPPERIGVSLSGIVIDRQTLDKRFSDIRNFGFAELASSGFPDILQRVGEGAAKQTNAARVVCGKWHSVSSVRTQ